MAGVGGDVRIRAGWLIMADIHITPQEFGTNFAEITFTELDSLGSDSLFVPNNGRIHILLRVDETPDDDILFILHPTLEVDDLDVLYTPRLISADNDDFPYIDIIGPLDPTVFNNADGNVEITRRLIDSNDSDILSAAAIRMGTI